MTTGEKTFQDISKEVVQKFITNVLCIDDKACYKGDNLPNIGEEFNEPDESFLGKPTSSSEQAKSAALEAESATRFDALKVIKSFNEKEILCSVLSDENINVHLSKVHSKADVILFDWEMDDSGEKAIEGIKLIIESDESVEPRLRVITIYTGHKDLLGVLHTIDSKISGFEKDEDNLRLRKGHTLITILAKEDTAVTPEYENKVVSYEKLPDTVIEEFATITSGLISNTAISAITAIRDNTHSLLGQFSSKYDPAYLADRAMNPNPSSVEESVTEVMLSALGATIGYENVVDYCSVENIKKWFADKVFIENHYQVGKGEQNKKDISNSIRLDWIKNGFIKAFVDNEILDDNKAEKTERNLLNNDVIGYFTPVGSSIESLNEDYAQLCYIKSQFNKAHYSPKLTLGTIIHQGETGQYLLCIQQRCDSIRLKENEERNFLFLPLIEVGESKRFDLIFYSLDKSQKKELKYLQLPSKSYEIETIKFKAQNSNDEVVAKANEDQLYIFKDIKDIEYKWILDIKDLNAQKIVNDHSSKLDRVGVDLTEWLRRSANKS